MKLIVFGAGGRLGRRPLDEALARGHEVTAAGRDASRLGSHGGRVRGATADATDPGAVARVAAGHDAALSAVTQHERPEMLVDAAHGLLAGLSRAGVRRLVVAGGAGSLKAPDGQRIMDAPGFHDEWKPEAIAQAAALEAYAQADTDVEWSYISPGALLEAGERTGRYRIGEDELLTDEHGHSRITM